MAIGLEFNVYLNDEDFEEPKDEPIYYLLAANGLFKISIGKFISSSSLVFEPKKEYKLFWYLEKEKKEGKKLEWLKEHKEYAKIHFPKKIPQFLIDEVIEFFREVYKKFKGSEAICLFYYKEKEEEYELIAPEQEVGCGFLPTYKVGPNPQGKIRIGTIHSHGSLGAFHSSTDNGDEKHDDGLHITVGNLNRDLPSISCSVVAEGIRCRLELEEIADITDKKEFVKDALFPSEWIERVKEMPYKYSKYEYAKYSYPYNYRSEYWPRYSGLSGKK